MSRNASAVALGAVATLGLGVTVLVSPGAPALAAEIYLFVLAALVLAAIVLRVASVFPRAEPAPPQSPPRSQRPGQLESVARMLELAETSSFELHNRLRPIVRQIAAARLARRGVALDRQPDRARRLLGETTWEIVRPDLTAPVGRLGPGCSREELQEIVAALEAI